MRQTAQYKVKCKIFKNPIKIQSNIKPKIKYKNTKCANNLSGFVTNGDIQMANEHISRCSTLFIILEMQTKTKMRNLYEIPIITKFKKADNIRCWQRCDAIGNHIHFCWKYKMVQQFWTMVV